MEKRDISLWQFVGFAAVSLAGTLLHFLYDWIKSPTTALISGVNESTWEHMKLLFFPLLVFAVVERFFVGRDFENYWSIKLSGTLLGLLLIPVLFYTLNGAFGKTPDWVNIALFFVAAGAALLYEARQFQKGSKSVNCPRCGLLLLCLIALSFFVFTFFTPALPLFRDPLTGTYGLNL